jgi:N-acetylmuramoyl-L-alanine amidase
MFADGDICNSRIAKYLRHMREITHIVVHCTATPEERQHTAADVRRWHKARGWRDIGYHWLIRLDGTIEPGRAENQVGSHVAGHNAKSIGVVYVGGIDKDTFRPKDTRTPEQRAALLNLLKDLKSRYPKARILGHRDFPSVNKACPSFGAEVEYANL